MLAAAGGTTLGVGLGLAADRLWLDTDETSESDLSSSVPFWGPHQAGVGTAAQNYLQFASFDLRTESLSDLRELMGEWTRSAAAMTEGTPVSRSADPNEPPGDTGETIGLEPASLSITFGFGPTLFERDGRDRLGLQANRPADLIALPPFRGEALEEARSGGDLCIQACANDPQVAFHAVHDLARIASSVASIRWLQSGFGRTSSTTSDQTTPRNLMGFKDGTNNVRGDDGASMARYVWVGAGDQPSWIRGGSYLIARRIRILLDVWDSTTLGEQERTIGRHKVSGAPLGARNEHDPVDLDAGSAGAPTIPSDAHIRLASHETNGGERILRRGYSYSDGYDPATGQIDAGLFFIAFQRSPARQFIPIQRRLAANDALNHHILHTASAIFAVPPGAQRSGYVGDTLL
jgi:deferrochelatase/peroxidase EfeB